MKWLEDSIDMKKVQPYDQYYLKDKEYEKKYHFDLRSLLKETPFAEHLEGNQFCILDHVYNIDDLEELIESAHGVIISSYKNLKRKEDKENLIIIADKNNDREEIKNLKNSKYNYQIYNPDLILDSVYTQNLDLDKSKYKL
jgi:hypothetical protein